MEMLNIKDLIRKAREALAGKNVRKLAAIHAGVTVAAGLLVTLLQYALAQGMGDTSGLAGLGTQAILETIQTALQWANMILMPFWNLGFLYVALQWVRGNNPVGRDLLTGFHRIGPCLGLMVNRTILTFCVVMLAANISSILYMTMPASAWLREMTMGFTTTDEVYEYMYSLNSAQILELFRKLLPMVVMSVALSMVVLVPTLFRFRLAEFAILNYAGVRGISAMAISAALLRRRCWQLFKLDLRLWWYYGLKMLCLGLLYVDMLLGAFGIVLPFGEMNFLVVYLLYLAGLFLVETMCRPQVDTAYAAFYEKMVELGPVQKRQVPAAPQKMPWDEQ